ncbi:MAG: hypothetical protein IJ904_01370 [Candidatus Methanomethylophilaceae archaeon]|nr:hypothetical protein [Candidatus Methanomethylophilaceae archaeon]MBR6205499.1 hypothetical protein [Candidatus Methanomethylophilaceae archaeon]
MAVHELDGIYVVRFDSMSNGRVQGRIDGDPVPVFAHEDSLPALLGEVWECSLVESVGRGGTVYYAYLRDKIEEETSEDAPAEPIPQESEDEDVFVIDKDDDDSIAIRFPDGRVLRRRKYIRYAGDDTLHTDMIKDGRYIVYASLDNSRIQIIPAMMGDFTCDGGCMTIDDLGGMVDCSLGPQFPYLWEGDVLTVFLKGFPF